MERHPIQLINLHVDELYIKVLDRQKSESEHVPRDFTLTVSRSEYDAESKIISVKIQMEMMPDEESPACPFEMRIAVAGHFQVDEERFPIAEINNFAEKNAPIILIPYIREHSYSLTVRAGVKPMIFPLITVPVFKISNVKEKNQSD
ncbi:hypothetical protein V2K00_11390 [Pseudomonas alliivorans]|nr:hypothetical protein [Pseudomonas alliivorans]MEE5094924.1 hypothetical protein [Pseudomonas alliivorans]